MTTLPGIAEGPNVALLARVATGVILLVAGLGKVGDRRRFADLVQNYGLLPMPLARAVGQILPVVEVMVAAGLLAGLLLPWSALVAIGLFLAFGGAVAVNLLRGHRDIDCGCFGPGHGQHLTWILVARNGFLAGLAAMASGGPHDVTWPWSGLAAAEVIMIILLAGAVLALPWLVGMLWRLWRLPRFESPGAAAEAGDQGLMHATKMTGLKEEGA